MAGPFPIRQGATHKVVLGPAVAVANGYVPVTTLALNTADEAEVILHDNGTVVDISGYTMAAITTADGYYHLTLQSGISGTVGHMTVVINDDSLILPLRGDFVVLEEAVYDQLYAASAPGAATVAALATAQADLDTITGSDGVTLATTQSLYAPATAAALAAHDGKLDTVDGIVDAIVADTNELQTDWANGGRLDLLIDAILADTNELQTDWVNGGRLDLLVDAILADTNELQTDWANGGRLDLIVDAILADTGTTLDAKIDAIDAIVDAIKAKTDSLTFTVAGAVDANAKHVNDTALTGTGVLGDEWGPA